MTGISDRRQHPRFDLDEVAFCYVEGMRVDCRCSNVSASGVLIQTREELPMSAVVAIVIGDKASSGPSPVFISGRVARRHGGDSPGYGLHWLHAATQGGKQILGQFLQDVLRVADPSIVQSPEPGLNPPLFMHRFPQPDAAAAPQEDAPAPERLPPELERAVSVTSGAAPAAGPLTQRLSASDLRAPCGLRCTVSVGAGEAVSAKIAYLGMGSMFVIAKSITVKEGEPVSVQFAIKTLKGDVQLTCRCSELDRDCGTKTGLTGIELALQEVDEASYPGLLGRYVRWLHYRAVQEFNE